jgi:ribonuclease-3 family protein
MEQAVSLLDKIKKEFNCKEVDIRTYSPLTLAFIGDSVYDLIIRTIIVERGNRTPNSLHKSKSAVVKAQTQAAFMEAAAELLTEEEEGVYRRGRNAKSYTTAKNATIADYRKATGMEALLGYLYLQGKEDRILELVKKGLHNLEIEL